MSNECETCGSFCKAMYVGSGLKQCCVDRDIPTDEYCEECLINVDKDVKPVPKLQVVDQNLMGGVVYTSFKCGCDTMDNRKRLFEIVRNCGIHTPAELQEMV